MSPGPAGGPNNSEGIDAEYEREADDDESDAEIKMAIGGRHCAPPCFQIPERTACDDITSPHLRGEVERVARPRHYRERVRCCSHGAKEVTLPKED